MEFKEAIRILRSEIGMTQVELAAALQVRGKTVSRWEVGESLPHIGTIQDILALAEQKGASEHCMENLRSAVPAQRTQVLRLPKSKLYPVDKESICDLVDESHNAVYVCDLATDEILYANKKAEEYAGKHYVAGEKCYEFLYHRTAPCKQCPKASMIQTESAVYHMVSPRDGRRFLFRGRTLTWNGKPAHAQYFFEEPPRPEAPKADLDLLNQLDVGICTGWVHDDGRLEPDYISDGCFAVLGIKKTQQSFAVLDVICEEDRQRVWDTLLAASKARQSVRITCTVQLEDGTRKELYAKAKYIKRKNGKSLYYGTIEENDRELNSGEKGK